MQTLKLYFQGFVGLFYPQLCIACSKSLIEGEKKLCTECFIHLGLTNLEDLPDNKVEQSFWGRCKIEAATSLLYFSTESITQNILHQIKYKNNQDAAVFMGKQMGKKLKESSRYQHIDAIAPIPLHPKKLRQRGYNQSLLLAEGIAEEMNVELLPNLLFRNKHSSTQTRKSRIERFKNVEGIFEYNSKFNLEGRHVLLIDDVITTGSTMEAAAISLNKIPDIKISLASLAFADV